MNFRRVEAEELRLYVEENRRQIHQKTLVKIMPLLEESNTA